MKIRTQLIIILVFSSLLSSAQEGNLFLGHFTKPKASQLQNWSIAQDSSNNIFFANRKGILKYNGETWEMINTPFMPYALFAHPQTGRIYVGAERDIGKLTRDKKGIYHYNSLAADTLTSGEFINIEFVDSVLYFMSEKVIIRMDPDQPGKKRFWRAGEKKPFTGIIHTNKHVFINVWKEGLHRLQKDTLFPIVSGFWTKDQEILFSLPYDSSRVLLGTDDNQLYLFDGMKFYRYRVKNHTYIEESILAGGRNISPQYFAVSTLAGGVVIIDKQSREIVYTINYRTGLPDDEVAALALDRNRGLWISHASGITRADFHLPVRNFTTYPGKDGKLTKALEHDGMLYLATGEGVYRLEKERQYREQEVTVRVEEEVPVTPDKETQAGEPAVASGKEDQSKKEQEEAKAEAKEDEEPGGFVKFFNRIFKGKEEAEAEAKAKAEAKAEAEAEAEAKAKAEAEAEEEEEQGRTKVQSTFAGDSSLTETDAASSLDETSAARERPLTETRISYKKKKIYSLQSITHTFNKIEAIQGKCDLLFPLTEGILAGTHDALYYINGGNAQGIVEGIHPQQIIPFKGGSTFLVATQTGIVKIFRVGDQWQSSDFLDQISGPVYSLSYGEKTGTLWAGSDDKAYKIHFGRNSFVRSFRSYSMSTEYSEKYFVRYVQGTLNLMMSSGIYRYHAAPDSFSLATHLLADTLIPGDYQYILSQPGLTWAKYATNWQILNGSPGKRDSLSRYLRLFDNIRDISLSSDNHLWIIADNQLYRIDLNDGLPDQTSFKAFFTSVRSGNKYYARQQHMEIEKENIPVVFRIAAPQYIRKNSTQYQYRIEGLMNDWSKWSTDPTIRIYTQKGEYTVRARARNLWGQISETGRINYHVPPPFTETRLFYGILAVSISGLFFMVIKLHEKKLRHDKRLLEEAVKERTGTIEEQKSEITTQRDAILEQKNTIEQKNKEITGSIEYARRIQTALLPKEEQFNQAFSDHFILFKPRSIVSGDFYWIHTLGKRIYVTAADCTGHGVPGAFMSMLGISSLNEIVSNHQGTPENAAVILNRLRETVKNSLHQTGKRDLTKDGMDISFCVIDLEKGLVDFAGAFNPLYVFREGVFEKFSGDRMPAGIYHTEKSSFTNHRFEIKSGDTLYLFSDGYVDQLGGPHNKKFKPINFMRLLSDIQHLPMDGQKQMLEEQFEEWKGHNFQVDDVIVLGIKI